MHKLKNQIIKISKTIIKNMIKCKTVAQYINFTFKTLVAVS